LITLSNINIAGVVYKAWVTHHNGLEAAFRDKSCAALQCDGFSSRRSLAMLIVIHSHGGFLGFGQAGSGVEGT
jgi:hypothetical protein